MRRMDRTGTSRSRQPSLHKTSECVVRLQAWSRHACDSSPLALHDCPLRYMRDAGGIGGVAYSFYSITCWTRHYAHSVFDMPKRIPGL